MKKDIEKEIKNITNKIAEKYQPEKIILFGSYVWGDPNPDSDIDLFIIKKTMESPHKRRVEVSRIIQDREFPVDILVYTPKEVENRLKLGDFFVKNVITKGRMIEV